MDNKYLYPFRFLFFIYNFIFIFNSFFYSYFYSYRFPSFNRQEREQGRKQRKERRERRERDEERSTTEESFVFPLFFFFFFLFVCLFVQWLRLVPYVCTCLFIFCFRQSCFSRDKNAHYFLWFFLSNNHSNDCFSILSLLLFIPNQLLNR